MITTYACAHCGGTNVFVDAYVSLNDPEHVRPIEKFSKFFCDDCDGECDITELEEIGE